MSESVSTSRRSPWPARLLVLALVLGTGLLGWRYAVRDHVVPRNFGTVVPGRIYRSASLTPAATERVVREHGIRTIIDLGGFDKLPTGEKVAQRTAGALGVERHTLWLEGDGRGDPNKYAAALRILVDPDRQPVLIHCSAGAERTSGLVMLYRNVVEGLPFDETYPESFGYHHRTHRNPKLKHYIDYWGEQIVGAYRGGAVLTPTDEEWTEDFYRTPRGSRGRAGGAWASEQVRSDGGPATVAVPSGN